ncbi:MAG: pyridoxamine 5'-phosphate oxidase [Kofleriaceae bacterium]
MADDSIWHLGKQYAGIPLDPADCDPDPIAAFRAWFGSAVAAQIPAVNAMTLATVDDRGRPAARIVLLKEVDERGFVFFTNYDSRKGRDLAAHPFAALVFYWDAHHRQVRVEGAIERISAAESDAYFKSRPRGSQLGAIASPQSQPIAGREVLGERIAELTRELGKNDPTRPAHWGGFRVIPEMIELWQGQPSRLHDRVRYQLIDGAWIRDRLAP